MHPSEKIPIIERFLAKVEKTESCWRWTGGCSSNGYGSFQLPRNGTRQQQKVSAHRFSYEHIKGRVPEGLTLDHLCRNRWCVNPAHLEAVTSRVNTLRSDNLAALNARKTHCANGHEFSKENTRFRRGGARTCRECQRTQHRDRERERRKQGFTRKGDSRKWTLSA